MLWVSGRLDRAQKAARAEGPGPASLREAQGHFYAAQSSQAQGRRAPEGFLFQQARADVYRHLLRAERALDSIESAPAWPAKGRRLLLSSDELTLVVDPDRGGQIVELSDKSAGRSLLDVQAGPAAPARRSALVDHLLPEDTDFERFRKGWTRPARLFSGGRWEAKIRRERPTRARAVLTRTGAVACTKTVELSGRTVRVRHQLRAGSARRQTFLFATEINLALKDAHVNRAGEARGVRRFTVVDPAAHLQVAWAFNRPSRLWHFPLESGTGLDRVYQGVRLAWVWPVRFGPGRTWEVRWTMTIGAPDGPAVQT